MILNDKFISRLIEEKKLILPSNTESIQPSSYDLHLDDTILIPTNNGTVQKNKEEVYIQRSKNGYILPSGTMVLASTSEWVNIPDDIMGKVEGISSVGRLGLFVHAAGVIDPGFKGKITLELINCSGRPIDLTDFDRIAQIIFCETKGTADPYNGKYQNQEKVTGSRLYQENPEFFDLVQNGTIRVFKKDND